jgi:hypothetical protein
VVAVAVAAKRNGSVVFVFIPDGRDQGCVIRRLDPHGSNENDYTQSTGSCVGEWDPSVVIDPDIQIHTSRPLPKNQKKTGDP